MHEVNLTEMMTSQLNENEKELDDNWQHSHWPEGTRCGPACLPSTWLGQPHTHCMVPTVRDGDGSALKCVSANHLGDRVGRGEKKASSLVHRSSRPSLFKWMLTETFLNSCHWQPRKKTKPVDSLLCAAKPLNPLCTNSKSRNPHLHTHPLVKCKHSHPTLHYNM